MKSISTVAACVGGPCDEYPIRGGKEMKVISTAGMYITEYAYKAEAGEYVEFTNLGGAPIDLTGWSYDDDSRLPGVLDLSAFGVVQPGESVIITETLADVFRQEWSLDASVKIIGEYTNNIGRNDEINLYDQYGSLIDRLTYGDEDFPGSFRTDNISANPLYPTALGVNDIYQWVASSVGDEFGSYMSASGSIGNPGFYVPEPTTLFLLLSSGLLLIRRR